MRKHTKRKHWGYVNPIAHAVSGAIKVKHSPNLIGYVAKTHLAMQDLVRGVATKEDMQSIIMANNMVAALMKQGFATPHEEDIQASTDAIDSIVNRAIERKRLIATGPEINALNFMLQIHDALFDVVSVLEYNKAVDFVNGVVTSGKSQAIKLGELL